MKFMIKVLKKCEVVTGQLINLKKSVFYVHEKVNPALVATIRKLSQIKQGTFTFIYLGCPIFHGRNKICCYDSIVKKIGNRIQSWNGKLISYGGRVVLINHVFQGMHINLLSTLNLPKGVIRKIHSFFFKSFWNDTVEKKSRHWVNWDTLCLQKKKRGVGFRTILRSLILFFCKL